MNRMPAATLSAVSLFAAMTAVGAFIKIPLPYVPFTLQILFTYLAGSLLGSKKGSASQLLYVGIGLAGIPVFTNGAGFGYIFQPTFGYLIGFILGAYTVGFFLEKIKDPKANAFIIANMLGLLVVYACGVPYLYMALNTWMNAPASLSHVLMIGFVYSLPGDILLAVSAGYLAKRLYPVFRKNRTQSPTLSQNM
ncbi:biotin transporter BioY [Bacillus massilinigeriensis]|uniref:biotin transporter BioY n=1 Tax=Bacillus mediterraneensis TaxID=1805474 RepID=UPI000A7DE848|nr:biotin transporter BioY [Bacillus mediterraneensis]